MADADRTIRSTLLAGVPHAFLDARQSDAGRFDLARHAQGPVFLRQVHSARAIAVTAPFPGDPPEADALVTATRGLALAIRTADCAPVLLWDRQAGVIGAAHAGWRGALAGVLEATVAAMEHLGASRSAIRAAIGPTIAQPSYEVDVGFREHLLASDISCDDLFVPGRPGHYHFDLPGYVARRLVTGCGIDAVDDLALDTYANGMRFHSFRRATHRGEATSGRQVSLISL